MKDWSVYITLHFIFVVLVNAVENSQQVIVSIDVPPRGSLHVDHRLSAPVEQHPRLVRIQTHADKAHNEALLELHRGEGGGSKSQKEKTPPEQGGVLDSLDNAAGEGVSDPAAGVVPKKLPQPKRAYESDDGIDEREKPPYSTLLECEGFVDVAGINPKDGVWCCASCDGKDIAFCDKVGTRCKRADECTTSMKTGYEAYMGIKPTCYPIGTMDTSTYRWFCASCNCADVADCVKEKPVGPIGRMSFESRSFNGDRCLSFYRAKSVEESQSGPQCADKPSNKADKEKEECASSVLGDPSERPHRLAQIGEKWTFVNCDDGKTWRSKADTERHAKATEATASETGDTATGDTATSDNAAASEASAKADAVKAAASAANATTEAQLAVKEEAKVEEEVKSSKTTAVGGGVLFIGVIGASIFFHYKQKLMSVVDNPLGAAADAAWNAGEDECWGEEGY